MPSTNIFPQKYNLPKTRTVLVKGIRNQKEFDEFIDSLPSDTILEYYSIPNTFFILIKFYDIRKAIDFHTNVNKNIIEHLSAEYTISRNEMPDEDCIDQANQASIIIHYKNTSAEDVDILDLVKTCGEIKECRMEKPGQKIFEYYDLRCAKKSVEELDLPDWKNGSIKVRYVWDIMPYLRENILKETDEIVKSEMKEQNIEIDETIKKLKVSKAKPEAKNIFFDTFDSLILKNLDKIEEIFNNNYHTLKKYDD